MARKTYKLSDETFKALSGHESATAREMECDPSYIYKIKNGDERDPFPPFRELFRANSNAGGAAEFWLNDLTAIFIRSRSQSLCTSEMSAKILEKINDDARALATLVESLRDGHLDEHECHAILSTLAKNRETNSRIEKLAHLRLAEIKETQK